jgi:hypothetical protein
MIDGVTKYCAFGVVRWLVKIRVFAFDALRKSSTKSKRVTSSSLCHMLVP